MRSNVDSSISKHLCIMLTHHPLTPRHALMQVCEDYDKPRKLQRIMEKIHKLGGDKPLITRSRNAAMIPITPNMPPMMSVTEAPARSGRPSGPVM